MVYKSSTKQHKRENWDNIKDTYSWNAETDYRLHPEKYKVGKGEQGVLLCEPYKSEILPHWRFKDASISEISSTKIFDLFQAYLAKADFVGADMARKFLQMGYTRARRYANHAGGRKYNPQNGEELPRSPEDPVKAESAAIFRQKWQAAESNFVYKKMKADWKKNYG